MLLLLNGFLLSLISNSSLILNRKQCSSKFNCIAKSSTDMKKVVVLIGICLISTVHSFSQEIKTLYPTDDAFCSNEAPDNNFNGSQLLTGVASNSGVYVSLIKFNLGSIPSNAIIDGAELQLYVYDDEGVDNGRIHELDPTVAWNESTVTFNNMPYGTTDNISGITFSLHEGQHYINVTNFVKYWRTGKTNNGFQLYVDDSSPGHLAWLRSSEYSGTTYDPKLVIIYHIPCSIEVTSPGNGDILVEGRSFSISWNDNTDDHVKIELYDGGFLDRTISSSTPSDGRFSWHIPDDAPMSENCRIKISNASDAGCFDYGDYFSIIDFTLSPDPVEVASGSGSAAFNIGTTSFTSWSVSENSNWFDVSPSSGSGDQVVTISYEENTSTSARSGKITVSSSGIDSKSITVTQSGLSPALAISPENQDVGPEAGSTTFAVSSNISWTASDDAGWLTISPTSGSNNGTLTVNFTENTSGSGRTGTVTVTGNDVGSQSVTITQSGNPTLSVSPGSRNVGSGMSSTTFTVTSNTSWTAYDDADWLTIAPTNGSNDGIITANFTENTTTSTRTGTLTVSGSGIKVSVVVIQIAVGIESNETATTLYPNPVKDYISITWDAFTNAAIFDISGKKLMSSNVRTVDLRTLKSGVYLVVLTGKNNERITYKIIKK